MMGMNAVVTTARIMAVMRIMAAMMKNWGFVTMLNRKLKL